MLPRAVRRKRCFVAHVIVMCSQTVAGGCVLALACDFRVAASGKYNIGVDEVGIRACAHARATR